MSEPEEDFAALFEKSLQATRVDRGQTVEGTIVAIGPEVAFVDVGGKGEAQIEIDELKDEAGALEVAVGDRIQAVVVSTAGGVTLSRRLARGAASDGQTRRRVSRRPARGGQGGTRRQGRIRGADRPASRLLPVFPDRPRQEHGPGGTRWARLRVPHHRVSGRRTEPGRFAPRAARGGTAGARRGGETSDRPRRRADRPCHLGPRVRRVRRSRRWRAGPAPRVGDGMVPRAGHPRGRRAGRGGHGQGPPCGRGHAEDRPWVEATHRRSVGDGPGALRGGARPDRPRHAAGAVRGVRRTRAWCGRVGPCVDVRADRALGRVVQVGPGGDGGSVRGPERRCREEADRPCAGAGRRRTSQPGRRRRMPTSCPARDSWERSSVTSLSVCSCSSLPAAPAWSR